MKEITVAKQKELLSQIKKGGNAKILALEEIYKSLELRDLISKLILKSSSYRIDPSDLLHDAFLVFINKIDAIEITSNRSIESYIFGIAKFLYANKMRKLKPYFTENIEAKIVKDLSLERELKQIELKSELNKLLDQISDKCKNILTLWSYGYTFKEIKSKLSISSEDYARKSKHICYKKLLELSRSNTHLKVYLYE